jgi:hypothetical protein
MILSRPRAPILSALNAKGSQVQRQERGTSFNYVRFCSKWSTALCRNIRPLFNFDPPASPEEIHDASLQFVRKISGFGKPSKANEPAFHAAVNEIAMASTRLLHSLESSSPSKNREVEAAKARARSSARFSEKYSTS